MANLAVQQSEPNAKAAMRRERTVEDWGELCAPNGRLAVMYDNLWIAQLGGEKTGRVSKSRKRYVLLCVTPKPGGGQNIEVKRVLTKDVVDTLELSKKIHHDHEYNLYPVPGKVDGEPCQLLTL